jgi:hypothetical protein
MNRFNLENDRRQSELVSILQKAASDGVDISAAYGEVQEILRKDLWANGRIHSGERPDLNVLLGRETDPAFPFRPAAYDHGSMWEDAESKTTSLVFQPYDLSFLQLKNLVEICENHDLDVWINAKNSWHHAGASFLVELRRRRRKAGAR